MMKDSQFLLLQLEQKKWEQRTNKTMKRKNDKWYEVKFGEITIAPQKKGCCSLCCTKRVQMYNKKTSVKMMKWVRLYGWEKTCNEEMKGKRM